MPKASDSRTIAYRPMRYLDLTLPSLAENLALDEALLIEPDEGRGGGEVLRLWDARSPFIVLGRSSRIREEVFIDRARSAAVPIMRRVSGGASIYAAPGCMFYAVVLSLRERPQLRMLDTAHQFVMQRMTEALQPLSPRLRFDGTCDLVVDGRKVSGNSVRLVRDWMLYHGSLLLELDTSGMDELLRHPPREPDYRRARRHSDFVSNLRLPRSAVAEALRVAWKAIEPLHTIPRSTLDRLLQDRYCREEWHAQR